MLGHDARELGRLPAALIVRAAAAQRRGQAAAAGHTRGDEAQQPALPAAHQLRRPVRVHQRRGDAAALVPARMRCG